MGESRRGRRRPWREAERPVPRPTDEPRSGETKPVGAVIREALGRQGLRQGFALGRLSRGWGRIVGGPLSRETVPVALSGGALVVACGSAAWGAQVRFLAEEIRRRANAELGREEVRTVRIVVGKDQRKPLGHSE